jgi:hypothetical protein
MKTNKGAAGMARKDALPARIYQKIKAGFVVSPRKELKATKVFSVNTDFAEYVKNITYEKYTAEGEAAIVAEGSKNIPVLNDYVDDVTQKVVTIKQALVITDLERKALAAGNQEFQTRRVSEIRYRINVKMDTTTFKGDKQYKISGLLDFAGTKTYDFAKDIATMSGFEILEALRALKQKTRENDAIYDANVLLIPSSYMVYFTKGMSADNPRTVMSYIKEEAMFELIEDISALDDLKGTGKPKMVAIDADKENIELAIIQEPQQLSEKEDEADNLQINFGARLAGLMVYHSQALTYVSQP